MSPDPAQARAPLRSLETQSTPSSPRDRSHKRQRSKTVGTTFVSTTVVPASSSADVLSSLISSLTVLSDSAREQIRSARDLTPTTTDSSPVVIYPSRFQSDTNISIYREAGALDLSDGEEAEPPVAGYTRAKTKEKLKRPSTRDKWIKNGSGRETALSIGRSGSSQNLRRPPSGASSGIGIPSIERPRCESANSIPGSPATSTRSPLKMFFSSRLDEDSNSRDIEARSTRSFRTTQSKRSLALSQEPEKENHMPPVTTPLDEEVVTPPEDLFSNEPKTYSPLNPAVREDLSEHLIPSRRSSMRHSPRGRPTSKGSPSLVYASTTAPRSPTAIRSEFRNQEIDEQVIEEEDSTLRRIRELQRAKEKRLTEWQKEREMRHSERRKRPSTSQTQAGEDVPMRGASRSGPEPLILKSEIKPLPTVPLPVDQKSPDSASLVYARENGVLSPSPSVAPSMMSSISPVPRRHKRSLSTGLRRSGSTKQRPVDDIRSISEQVEAFLTAPRLTQRIRHPRTGRTVAFSEVGDPDGFAVFCCVGMGLTRYVTTFYDDVARTQKLRLITPDRPGIGESSAFSESACTPLSWVDDVTVICQTLNIERFSLLAHSAGSIYALATALKMPDRVRGRIHLLAPWIPPSQFPSGSANSENRSANLPIAHKILSVLPAPFLKAANSRFLSATSASIEPRPNKAWKKDKSISTSYDALVSEMASEMHPANLQTPDITYGRYSSLSQSVSTPNSMSPPPVHSYQNSIGSAPASPSPSGLKRQFSTSGRKFKSPTQTESPTILTPHAKQALYNSELTHRTWAMATNNANPAVDLLICFERRRPIGFKYVDVTRSVVVHHGRKDTRVPLANAQWLSKAMKRCELRILEDEGHGLMASANVMSKVLGEIGQEWEEWDVIAKNNEKSMKDKEVEAAKAYEAERRRYVREGRYI